MLIAACAAIGAAAHADDIVLRDSARLQNDADAVRLADIAELSGPEAARFADLKIADAARSTSATQITLRQVRDALDAAGVHWGKINLSGSAVTLRPRRSGLTSAPAAMTPVSITPGPDANAADGPAQRTDLAESIIDSMTVGGAVARLIVSGLHIAPADLQLVIDQRDEPLWLTAAGTSRFEIDPLTSMRSDRIDLTVRTWTDGSVQARATLTVRPLIQTRVATLHRDVNRGERLGEEDLAAQTVWLPPSQAAGASAPADAIGRLAARKLHSGEIVRQQQVRSENVIERGDRAMVRCLVGGAVITLQAEALADGARGESVEFRKLGERQSFTAVVSGPGEAVVDLGR